MAGLCVLELAVLNEDGFWTGLGSCKEIAKLARVSKHIRAALPCASRCVQLMLPFTMVSIHGTRKLLNLPKDTIQRLFARCGTYQTTIPEVGYGIPLHVAVRYAEQVPGGLKECMAQKQAKLEKGRVRLHAEHELRRAWLKARLESPQHRRSIYGEKLQAGQIPARHHELRCLHFVHDDDEYYWALRCLVNLRVEMLNPKALHDLACCSLWACLTQRGPSYWETVDKAGGGPMAAHFGELILPRSPYGRRELLLRTSI